MMGKVFLTNGNTIALRYIRQ